MTTINDILVSIGQKQALANKRPPLIVTPTRLKSFNEDVLKTGGLVSGRVYELFAPPSAGKSTLAQIICADYQKQGKIVAYIDAEGTTQTEINNSQISWMQNLGIDIDNLIMPNFGSAEDCFEIIKTLIVQGVNLIVLDTVAVLQPLELIFREEETIKLNERMALPKALTAFFNGIVGGFSAKNYKGGVLTMSKEIIGRLASNGISIKNPEIHKLWYYDCAFIGVNHAKNMIGVLYGDPIYTPGGAALGFHSSVRIGMTAPVKSKDKVRIGDYDVPLYRKTRVVAPKNKLAAPFGEMSLRIYQDGRVIEDIPFYIIAEEKGLVKVIGRNVQILKGDYMGETMRKIDFEQWVTEHMDFLNIIDDKVEVDDTVVIKGESKIKLPSIKSSSKMTNSLKMRLNRDD